MESIASTTSSTDAPRVLRPRPAPPVQRLHADMNPLLRDIDWNSHIPTAGPAPVPAYDDAWGRPSAWAAFGSAA